MTSWFDGKPQLQPGAEVSGKWHGRTYAIVRKLGEGSNGAVYLAECGGTPCALKIGFDPLDLQSEINALEAVAASAKGTADLERTNHAVQLLDADDGEYSGVVFPFYAMTYLRGRSIQEYLERYGNEWLPLLIMRILRQLSGLHDQGYVFGDLKEENVLVSGHGVTRLVDYGGVTEKGKAVRQFTERYDRGYWKAGGRTADEAYDIFSAAMLFLSLAMAADKFGRICNRGDRKVQHLLRAVSVTEALEDFEPFIRKALNGEYSASAEALNEFRQIVARTSKRKGTIGEWPWVEAAFAASILFCGSMLYLLVR